MLTPFQKSATRAIAAAGGTCYMQTDPTGRGDMCVMGGLHPQRIEALNPDGRTFGRIGWPTIAALLASGYADRDLETNKIVLNGKE